MRSMFTHCKKADIILDQAAKYTVKADVSIGPLDSLLITVPRVYTPSTEEPVTIAFLDPLLGMVICRCKLSSPLVSDDHKSCSYRCQVLDQLSQNQRREDMKIPVTANVQVTLTKSDTSAPATVCNISAGGVYLVTSLVAQIGDQLTFDFTQTGSVIPLTAEILRVESRMDRYNRLVRGYGCRFVRLSPQYEAQLRGYVFQEEKRQYKGT